MYHMLCLAGDTVRPSEVVRTLTMRLQKLAGALANSNHHMQVVFLVTDGLERSIVQQVMGKHPNIKCRSSNKNDFGKVLAGAAVCSDAMFTAKNRVVG